MDIPNVWLSVAIAIVASLVSVLVLYFLYGGYFDAGGSLSGAGSFAADSGLLFFGIVFLLFVSVTGHAAVMHTSWKDMLIAMGFFLGLCFIFLNIVMWLGSEKDSQSPNRSLSFIGIVVFFFLAALIGWFASINSGVGSMEKAVRHFAGDAVMLEHLKVRGLVGAGLTILAILSFIGLIIAFVYLHMSLTS